MSEAKKYLENLQGLLLFMHVKRKKTTSLYDLKKLDKLIRDDLEEEFRKCEDEILTWHNSRMEEVLNGLSENAKSHVSENARLHLTKEELEKELKETEKYIEHLRNTQTPSKFQDKVSYNIIEPIFQKVEKAAASLGVKHTPEIVLGTLYTERVNAAAIKIKKTGEYIIAFESQLFSFLNRFTKIITQTLPAKESVDPDKFAFSFLKKDVLKNIQEHPELKALFADLILSYVINGNVNQAQNLKLDYGRYINATYILRAVELFVMGHEYGHIVKGHLQAKMDSEIEIANISAQEIEHNWAQEYEADTLGLFFMIKILNDEGFLEDFTLIGADLFFIINEIIDKSRSIKRFGHENGSVDFDSHPPAKLRRENLRKAFRMSFSAQQLEIAEHLPKAFEDVLYYLWEDTKPLLYKHFEIYKGK